MQAGTLACIRQAEKNASGELKRRIGMCKQKYRQEKNTYRKKKGK